MSCLCNGHRLTRGHVVAIACGLLLGAGAVALFDHPRNLRHPCPWYVSMRGPKKNNFSTAPLFNKPYKLPAGKSLTLRYRALVHPQRGRKDVMEKEWNAFA